MRPGRRDTVRMTAGTVAGLFPTGAFVRPILVVRPTLVVTALVLTALVLKALVPTALVTAGSARAASFACANASTAVERTICGDPNLSAADSAMAALYQRLLARTPTPDTARNEQRRWLAAERNAAADATTLRALYAARIAALRDQLGPDPVASPRTRSGGGPCVRAVAQGGGGRGGRCRVVEAGSVPNVPGPPLAWQTQAYDEEGSGGLKVHVVYFSGTAEPPPVLAVLDAGVNYAPPRVIAARAGTLLYLIGDTGGTGVYPDHALFMWRGTAWSRVDIASWLDELARRLPKGLGAWKGIYPDWKSMKAETHLWRTGDGNCCPTGGVAEIWLRLEGPRVVLDRFRIEGTASPTGGR